MRPLLKFFPLLLTVFTLGTTENAFSQTDPLATYATSQIFTQVDDAKLVQLNGNVHPHAISKNDIGMVGPSLPMDRMLLILRRSPAQEAALQKFMVEQYDPKSTNYHRWLSPDEFGALYGPSDADMQTITSWLQNSGFAVTYVSKGRVFIEFSGTAATVQKAFHTEIHRYLVNGEEHIANSTNPSIPEALQPVVVGIFSLHNFLSTPLHRDMGSFRRDTSTIARLRERSSMSLSPVETSSSSRHSISRRSTTSSRFGQRASTAQVKLSPLLDEAISA